ncbi:MAG: macro domain-containing protein [Cetobacterium sp.]
MIRLIKGDIVNSKEEVILHQVNCFTMGAGVAKALYTKYPKIKKAHTEKIEEYKKNRKELLGKYDIVSIDCNKHIVNCFSQFNYGRDRKCYTQYDLLFNCIEQITFLCEKNKYNLAMPFNIGCGLAGGDWNIVIKGIQKIAEKYPKVNISLYEL